MTEFMGARKQILRRRVFVGVFALALLGACTGSVAVAEESMDDRSFSLEMTFSSRYVWRGINLVDDPVFQPSISATHRGFTLSIWGNMEMTNSNDEVGEFTEIDYVFDYTWSWNELSLSAGAIHYQFPNVGPPTTTEVYGGVGLDVLLSPTLTVYQDVDQADGTYAALSLGHTFEGAWAISDGIRMSVDLSSSIGYGSSNFTDFYYGSESVAFTDALISVGLPIAIVERWTITPSVSYSSLLDGGVRRGMDEDDNVWGGLSLSFSF